MSDKIFGISSDSENVFQIKDDGAVYIKELKNTPPEIEGYVNLQNNSNGAVYIDTTKYFRELFLESASDYTNYSIDTDYVKFLAESMLNKKQLYFVISDGTNNTTLYMAVNYYFVNYDEKKPNNIAITLSTTLGNEPYTISLSSNYYYYISNHYSSLLKFSINSDLPNGNINSYSSVKTLHFTNELFDYDDVIIYDKYTSKFYKVINWYNNGNHTICFVFEDDLFNYLLKVNTQNNYSYELTKELKTKNNIPIKFIWRPGIDVFDELRYVSNSGECEIYINNQKYDDNTIPTDFKRYLVSVFNGNYDCSISLLIIFNSNVVFKCNYCYAYQMDYPDLIDIVFKVGEEQRPEQEYIIKFHFNINDFGVDNIEIYPVQNILN